MRWTQTLAERFWSKVSIGGANDCWEWQAGLFHDGYGKFRGDDRRAHRQAYILVKGPIPDGLLVRHRCDNRKCCNLLHLELGTVQDNNNDTRERGRLNPGSLYDQELIECVRSMPGSQYAIAAATGISQSHVSRIKAGFRA